MLSHPCGFTDHLNRILVVFKGGDKSEGIEGMVLEGHVVRISQYQITIKKMHALPQHKRRDVPAAGFNAYFLPPAGKAGGSAAKLQQSLNARIFFYQLGNDFLLPNFGPLVPTFIPKFIRVGVFSVKKPFLSALPLTEILSDKIKFFFHHFLSGHLVNKCPDW